MTKIKEHQKKELIEKHKNLIKEYQEIIDEYNVNIEKYSKTKDFDISFINKMKSEINKIEIIIDKEKFKLFLLGVRD